MKNRGCRAVLAVLVLLLVTILFSMAYFVRSDITRNFTLFRIQF